jgi:SAM-dependent methyltransferase
MNQCDTTISSHYKENYFENYQKAYGEFGGRANKFMFEKHISPDDVVLDFGCGGGFLLKDIGCAERIGIEINPVARKYCNQVNGISCYESLEFIPDRSIDVIISSHCLEHTTNPYELVAILFKKLKTGGRIVLVVPLENYHTKWLPHNIDNHLYSFSPMNLGNILQGVGFSAIRTGVVLNKWMPAYKQIENIFGLRIFHHLSWLYGRFLNRRCVQIKGYAVKTGD